MACNARRLGFALWVRRGRGDAVMRLLEHDPEKWIPVSEKIMLDQ